MAKKNDKNADRRLKVEQMRKDQARKERTRSLAILGACLVVVLGLIGSAVFVAVKDHNKKEKLRNTALAKIGSDEKAAGCDPILTKETDHTQEHVPSGPITYADAPPSFGKHRPSPAAFGRPFYTDDRPEVPTLVHNLEHGYVVAWYDDTFAKDKTQMDQLKAIAEKYQDEQGRFIAAPWHSSDGAAFPDGKHLALTRWSAKASDPGNEDDQRGNWQYCTSVSGSVISSFFDKWPNAQSPEPGLL